MRTSLENSSDLAIKTKEILSWPLAIFKLDTLSALDFVILLWNSNLF